MPRHIRPLPALIPALLLAVFTVACSEAAPAAAKADATSDGSASAETSSETQVGVATVGPCGTPQACESKASARLQAARNDPVALTALLKALPKGGDLHNHMTGAVYAEQYLAWATADKLCFTANDKALDYCSAKGAQTLPPAGNGTYDDLVRAWSMKDFPLPIGAKAIVASHDHFFATFSKFGPAINGRYGDILADLMQRAAEEHTAYLELMITPYVKNLANVADGACPKNPTDLPACHAALLADPDLASGLKAASAALDTQEATARTLLGCDGATPQLGCATVVRYLFQGKRLDNNNRVFAQLVAGFELAKADPRVVGVNLVQPEDAYNALANYDQHMQFVAFVGKAYAGTGGRIALHAGELSPEVLSASEQVHLQSHVRKAVEVAHAERIGHGTDLLLEKDYLTTLELMKAAHVTVEICPTSNYFILGVTGTDHPVKLLLAAGVRIAIATDDQGVARSNLTLEYQRAVVDLGLTYPEIKGAVRNSLEAAFVQGASLWVDFDALVPVAACIPAGTLPLGRQTPSPACAAFLAASVKAKLQHQLETALSTFEAH